VLNVLSQDLAHGCPQWVDVSGRTYGVDRSPQHLPRSRNRRWQHDVVHYLLSGNAFVLKDVRREGLNRHTLAILRHDRAVASGDTLVIRYTAPRFNRPSIAAQQAP
jgi:hypothetical protein